MAAVRKPARTGIEAGLLNSPLLGRRTAYFRRALLRWYDGHRRDLPWRKTGDPYRIWLSEVMLQQTRVAAVLDHYRIFLQRFPDIQTLAAASESDVLSAWSGLGYYRRARMLHRSGRQIAAQHGGQLPRTAKALLDLPGIGRYTAAAIASIAFGEAVAVVDGNVERVLARLAGDELTAPENWRLAQELLDASRPGDFNQAVMELGATVCVPKAPKCEACPVRKWCGHRTVKTTPGLLEAMGRRASPRGQNRAPRKDRQHKKEIWRALNLRDGRVQLVRRSLEESLMPGMWELPRATEFPRTSKNPRTVGISPAPESPAYWRVFRHSVTVTDYTVHVLRNVAPQRRAAKTKWVAIGEVGRLPITGLTRKVLRAGGII